LATEIVIKTASIDGLIESGDLVYPRFVKIDVEGSEGSVLQGMLQTLAAAKPILFVECSEAGRQTTWFLLRGLGYRCQLAATRQWVDEFEDYRHSDFLWLPPDLSTTSQLPRSSAVVERLTHRVLCVFLNSRIGRNDSGRQTDFSRLLGIRTTVKILQKIGTTVSEVF
jgi:Methyltransferase FkbM domain